jgi:thiamine biosynthesis lipoprotein
LALILLPAGSCSAAEGASPIRPFVFETMTTEAHVLLPPSSSPPPEEIFAAAREAVLEAERLMSPSGEGSDVARFNRSGVGAWVEVSPLTLRVLEECAAGHSYSGGAFDPTVGALKGLFDFSGGEEAAWPSEEQIRQARETVGFGGVTIDPGGSRVFKPREGMKLDLGAAAKGFAVDRALAAMSAAGASSALVEIGGEVGTLGMSPVDAPWRVMVQDPRSRGGRLAFELANSALATSGGRFSYFTRGGVKYTHIIDPRTGTPVPEGTLQATVAHPSSCLAADVMSTSLFILGPDGAKAALEAYARDSTAKGEPVAGLEALFFFRGTDGDVRIRLFKVAGDGSVCEAEFDAGSPQVPQPR